jgi:hypothetical protein
MMRLIFGVMVALFRFAEVSTACGLEFDFVNLLGDSFSGGI